MESERRERKCEQDSARYSSRRWMNFVPGEEQDSPQFITRCNSSRGFVTWIPDQTVDHKKKRWSDRKFMQREKKNGSFPLISVYEKRKSERYRREQLMEGAGYHVPGQNVVSYINCLRKTIPSILALTPTFYRVSGIDYYPKIMKYQLKNESC